MLWHIFLPDFQRTETLVQLNTADHNIYKKKEEIHELNQIKSFVSYTDK